MSSATFELLIEAIVNQSRLRAECDIECDGTVDPLLHQRLLETAARLALLAITGRGSASEIAFARDLLAERERRMPIPTMRRGEVVFVEAPSAKPWQIELARIFTAGAFGHRLRPFPSARVDQKKSVLRAIESILAMLHRSATAPPRRFIEALAALAALKETQSITELSLPSRDYVMNAVNWMTSLLTAQPPDDVIIRIGLENLGGVGNSRTVSPWGAAVQFAACFDLTMPPRVHDVARAR